MADRGAGSKCGVTGRCAARLALVATTTGGGVAGGVGWNATTNAVRMMQPVAAVALFAKIRLIMGVVSHRRCVNYTLQQNLPITDSVDSV